MLNSILRYSLTALLAATLFTSCNPFAKDKEVYVKIELEAEGQPLDINDNWVIRDTAYQFDYIHFFLSHITLGDQEVSDVRFVDAGDPSSMLFTLPTTIKGAQEVSFSIGLDSLQNSSDPTTFSNDHPLSAANAMYWSWATKYRFLKIDGRMNVSGVLGTDDVLIAWHPGADALYRTAELDPSGPTVSREDTLVLKLDYGKYLELLDLPEENQTHTMPSDYDVAVSVVDAFSKSWSVSVR